VLCSLSEGLQDLLVGVKCGVDHPGLETALERPMDRPGSLLPLLLGLDLLLYLKGLPHGPKNLAPVEKCFALNACLVS
jgi:hypothetical protein